MKDVFIVGFSPAVKGFLETEFQGHCEKRTITWISEGRGVATDISRFKELLFSRIASRAPSEVLVVFAISPDNKWLDPQLERLVGEARNRHQHCRIGLDIYRDFGSINQLRSRILAFDLAPPDALSMDLISSKLCGSKVICIVATGRPTILDALVRVGFPASKISEHFEQEIVETGRNSTLMQHLEKYAKHYNHMLYAWGNLRTSSSGLVKNFKRKGIFFEAESAGKVAELFRRSMSKKE